jgi:phosphatidate phosphatase APP1
MKSYGLALVGLVVLTSLAACVRVSGSAGHANYQVTGIAGSDVPLAGVPVTMTDGAGNRTQSTVTDAHGHYTIETAVQRQRWPASHVVGCDRFAG